jgi:hypothetical protein
MTEEKDPAQTARDYVEWLGTLDGPLTKDTETSLMLHGNILGATIATNVELQRELMGRWDKYKSGIQRASIIRAFLITIPPADRLGEWVSLMNKAVADKDDVVWTVGVTWFALFRSEATEGRVEQMLSEEVDDLRRDILRELLEARPFHASLQQLIAQAQPEN